MESETSARHILNRLFKKIYWYYTDKDNVKFIEFLLIVL